MENTSQTLIFQLTQCACEHIAGNG